ncbi:MAG TPA: hypothetical protein VIY49_32980 [Bryobacteraceae bacterium]
MSRLRFEHKSKDHLSDGVAVRALDDQAQRVRCRAVGQIAHLGRAVTFGDCVKSNSSSVFVRQWALCPKPPMGKTMGAEVLTHIFVSELAWRTCGSSS